MMRQWLKCFVLVMLCCLGTAGFAQEPPAVTSESDADAAEAEDTAPSQSSDDTTDEDDTTRILVIGDSIAGGLGAGISRMAEVDGRMTVVNRFNEVSGLARTELYDWPSALSKILSANPVDIVVVHVGVNDRQDIRAAAGRLKFRSPEWEKAYTDNVDRLAATVKSGNARLYWISLPPMGDGRFDEDMQYLAALHKARVESAGAKYIDVRGFFLGTDGKYTERGPDDTGTVRKLRARDGIAFMKVGNNRFGQLALTAIMKEEEAATVAPTTPPAQIPATSFIGPPAPPAAVQTPAASATSTMPEFGQAGLDGQAITFRPDIKLAPVPELPKPPQPTTVAATTVVVETGPVAKPGSQSARLLKEGMPLTAPAGRFDDYAEPPPPAE
jgi:uncharacterized protein